MKKIGRILPGFFDSHLHLLGIGMQSEIVSLKGLTSIKAIQARLTTQLDKPIVFARGWNDEILGDKRAPERKDLDQASLEVPIVAYRVCGHVASLNTQALTLLGDGLDREIPGGTVDVDRGILTENALGLVGKLAPKADISRIKHQFVAAEQLLFAQGVTKVFSDDFLTYDLPHGEMIELLDELYRDGRLKIRIHEQVRFNDFDEFSSFIASGWHRHSAGNWRVAALKLLLDGSLGGRTAFLRQPYADDPHNAGVRTYPDAELESYFDLANHNQLPVHAHAIGDGAIEQFLACMERSLKKTNTKEHKHALVHAQLATGEQIERMARLKIAALVQPIFLESDIRMLSARIGKRKRESYRFKSMHEAGVKVCFGTDAPVEEFSPFANLFAAITRTSVQDHPLGAHLPEEAFTLKEALHCYRNTADFLAGDDKEAKNDIIELDKDIDEADLNRLRQAKVRRVTLAGTTVYEAV